MNTFDLTSLNTTKACNAGAEVEIRHPVTNAPLGIKIHVLGRDSDTFKEHTREMINSRLRKEAMAAKRGKDAELRTVEMIEQENMDLLVACTTNWSGVIVGGKELPFEEANVRQVYREYPWIYDQVNEAIGTLENFLKN